MIHNLGLTVVIELPCLTSGKNIASCPLVTDEYEWSVVRFPVGSGQRLKKI